MRKHGGFLQLSQKLMPCAPLLLMPLLGPELPSLNMQGAVFGNVGLNSRMLKG